MKLLSQRDLQNVSVDVLQKVHDFCVMNNLRYSLAYGTLIGAVRHKGFIPWDDDIDIIMPRPDYNYLLTHYLDNETKVFSHLMGTSYINYARVCDIKKTIVLPYTPWTDSETGVWIDIFPIDGLSETQSSFIEKIPLLLKYDALLFQTRGAKLSRMSKDLLRDAKIIGKRVLYGHNSIDEVITAYNQVMNLIDFDESIVCGQVAYPVYIKKEFMETDDYSSFIDISFEGRYFKCVKNYDKILRNYYNDYMKLPPENQRIPKHSEHIVCWK